MNPNDVMAVRSRRPRRVHDTVRLALAGLLISAVPATAEPAPTWDRALPLGANWAIERGIDLPNPFGAGVFLVTMTRDIEITDVRVTLPGNEPASISQVASFDVRNTTSLAAIKLDAWVLPVLDLYVLAGHSWTDSRLDATITIDRILGDPVVLGLTQDTEVGGPLFGAGATAAAGIGPWFIVLDANYSYSNIPELEDGIAAWFLSGRTGWSGTARWGAWRAWLGEAYLTTDRTLTVREESPTLGPVVVEIDQQPVHPLTFQVGGSTGFGKRWEVLAEAGSNFDDAFVGVFSASFRF